MLTKDLCEPPNFSCRVTVYPPKFLGGGLLPSGSFLPLTDGLKGSIFMRSFNQEITLQGTYLMNQCIAFGL
jgi:hypothetical protein